MKNVLFVGPYNQNDGWGIAAREYIRALRLVDCNLTVRPVYLNQQDSYVVHTEFSALETNRLDHYDVVIQNCLPHQFRHYGGVKNIGLAYFETSDISATPWPISINLMDEMWVCSNFEQTVLANSGVTIYTRKIPIPVDIHKYDIEYPRYDLNKNKDDFKFYFIGEYIVRKNLESLLLAFHREFRLNECVNIVLKLNKSGVTGQQLLQRLQENIYSMKASWGMYSNHSMYKQESIITNYLAEDVIYGLHQTCDCFVTASSGEAFCLPAFDAMMFGNCPIAVEKSSISEYIYDNKTRTMSGMLVDSTLVPAIAYDRPLPFLYNGIDTWQNVNVLDLQLAMRKAFTNHSQVLKDRRIENTRKILPKYSYANIAKLMGTSI